MVPCPSRELLRRLLNWTGKPRSVSFVKEAAETAVHAWPGVAVLMNNELSRASTVVLDQNTIALVEDDLRQLNGLEAQAVLGKAKAKLA